MLRDLTRNMPMNDALTKILRQTFDIPDQRPGTSLKKEREEPSRPRKEPRDAPPFHPQRYPSAFRAKGGDGSEGGLKVYKLQAGGSRNISFATAVENEVFSRHYNPGAISLAARYTVGKGHKMTVRVDPRGTGL